MKKKIEKIELKKRYGLILLLGVISTIFVYLFSYSTSPFYPFYYGGDSAQFQTVGKAWLNGMIPYRDVFDHKGPLIFFINMVGWGITKSATGIMLIQIVALLFTLIGIYFLSQLLMDNKGYGIMTVVLSLVILNLYYSEGNRVEEYCLPFICYSSYFQIRFLFKRNLLQKHNIKYSFFYGISISVCLLTRITNAITICVGVLLICIWLLKDKEYKELVKNGLAMLVGIMFLIIPFAIYFLLNNAFSDFLYGMIGYNLEYQKEMSSWLAEATGENWKNFIIFYFSSYCIFFTAFFAFKRKEYLYTVYCVLCGIMEMYLFCSGGLFPAYAIITLPQFTLFFNEVMIMDKKNNENRVVKTVILCWVSCLLFSNFIDRGIVWPIDIHNRYKQLKIVGYEEILKMVPEEELDSFIAYGGNDFKTLYLLNDILPEYKYFVIQEWHGRFSQKTKEDIYEVFANGNVNWILTEGNANNIQSVLDSKYVLHAEKDKYCLYKLKN
ncbi:MAG: glycosyltransferase family 39 protein [Lachnospiraceae bacterium]|nr:glycosyltransferase family 39 protein [Lachnospiraceae bacterium]